MTHATLILLVYAAPAAFSAGRPFSEHPLAPRCPSASLARFRVRPLKKSIPEERRKCQMLPNFRLWHHLASFSRFSHLSAVPVSSAGLLTVIVGVVFPHYLYIEFLIVRKFQFHFLHVNVLQEMFVCVTVAFFFPESCHIVIFF